jgi:hypothetical protein
MSGFNFLTTEFSRKYTEILFRLRRTIAGGDFVFVWRSPRNPQLATRNSDRQPASINLINPINESTQ